MILFNYININNSKHFCSIQYDMNFLHEVVLLYSIMINHSIDRELKKIITVCVYIYYICVCIYIYHTHNTNQKFLVRFLMFFFKEGIYLIQSAAKTVTNWKLFSILIYFQM